MLALNNFLMYYSHIDWLQTKLDINMMSIVTVIIKFFLASVLIIAFLKLGGCYAEQYHEANKRHQDGEKQLIVDHENHIKANWVKE